MHIVNISWTHLERSRVQHARCARPSLQSTSLFEPLPVPNAMCKLLSIDDKNLRIFVCSRNERVRALQRRLQKNMPARLPVHDEAYRLFGVDLSAVPGVSGGVFCVLEHVSQATDRSRVAAIAASVKASDRGSTCESPRGRSFQSTRLLQLSSPRSILASLCQRTLPDWSPLQPSVVCLHITIKRSASF
jgi:hypothetical protein